MYVDPWILASKLLEWVYEDAPFGDVTSETLIDPNTQVEALVIAKSRGIAACTNLLASALRVLGFSVRTFVNDGSEFDAGSEILSIYGSARRILLFERTLLNLMMLLFGIATKTRRLVNIVKSVNPRVRVAATRKVVPGLRYLVKKAVEVGGGDTHRFSLSDAILIKDNHIAIIGDVEKAILLARQRASFVRKIEVEVSTVEDAVKAAKAGADVVMLDNMDVKQVATAIRLLEDLGLRDKVIIEVSGGIDEDNIVDYARASPDVISTSSITMRPDKIDLSLEIKRVGVG